MADGASEWTIVTTSRKRPKPYGPDEVQRLVGAAVRKVEDCKREVEAHPVLASVVEAVNTALSHGRTPTGNAAQADGVAGTWEHIEEIVVYGLGSPHESRTSRYQLALVCALQARAPRLRKPPLLFDPIFSEVDKGVLLALGMSVIPENESGRRRVGATEGGVSLFYLAHCESHICEALLDANWEEGAIRRLVLLGNSFATYQDRWALPSAQVGRVRPEKLLSLVQRGAVVERRVDECGFPDISAFNDMSAHAFGWAAGV